MRKHSRDTTDLPGHPAGKWGGQVLYFFSHGFDLVDNVGDQSEADILATLDNIPYNRGRFCSHVWQAPQYMYGSYGG